MSAAPHDLATHPLTRWNGPLGLPDFARIDDADFGPVFDAALAAHDVEIAAIAEAGDTPTIANTLAALELAGDALHRVSAIFWCRAGADTNDAIQKLEREIAPKMSRHYSAIAMNEKLFNPTRKILTNRRHASGKIFTVGQLKACLGLFEIFV